MAKFFTVVLSLLIFSSAAFPQKENYVKGELIIQLKAGTNAESVTEFFEYLELKPERILSERMKIWLFSYNPERIEDDEVLFEIKQNTDVDKVQFNHYVTLRENNETTPNDPRYNEQWALNNTGQTGGTADADIDAPEAWDLATGGVTSEGDTIVIAIIDGGMDLNHQDLNYWINYAEIPGNGIDDDGNGYIDDYRGWNAYGNNGNVPSNSHGTHVAGIAAAKGNNGIGVSGVNWNAKILPIGGSSSNEALVVAAYGYVLEMRTRYNQTNGAQGAFIVVTNASFGVDQGQPSNYPIWCAIYDSLGEQGILNCGATANANWNIDVVGDIPTACPSPFMVSVTNTTSTDNKNSGAAYGLTTIDLGAPGTSILSTDLNNTYTTKTGTSMATPTVAGAIALMFNAANSNLIQFYKNNPRDGALIFRDFLFNGTDSIAALQGKTVTGGRLNVLKAIEPLLTPPDSVPPTDITDLAVTDTTSNSLKISWTAPLDTSAGGVAFYDIRISNSPISDSLSFYSAQQINYTGTPDSAGSTENFLIKNLDFNTGYYFAIVSEDRWGNKSFISNSANGTTFDAPQISVTPSSLNQILNPNNSVIDTISISNISVGSSTLDYEITLENNTFPEGSIIYRLINKNLSDESFQDNKEDPERSYGNSFEGFGGPDNFGYKWIDSDEPNGPAYVWEDISSSGTEVTDWTPTGSFDPKDEGYAGPFPLGFDFMFYGSAQSQLYISSNGIVLFNILSGNNFSNQAIPSASLPNGLIAPFWDDLDGRTQGTVYYKQDGNRFIVQFTNWQRYPAQGSLTFQVILHSTGKILFYYENMNATLTSATAGIENFSGDDGLRPVYNATYIKNSLAVKFATDPEWLTSNAVSGTLYNGNSLDVELSFRSEDYPLGNYSMDFVISSNDPLAPSFIVPVNMTNEPVPVELSYINAEAGKNNVTLSWVTSSETNNKGFEIYKKPGGEKTEWKLAGFVNGNGTTTEEKSYSFFDGEIKSGKYLYKLKQIDFDGKYEFSKEVEVTVALPEKFELFQNYPNPFNPSTTIEYSLPENSFVKLSVYSVVGELLVTIVNENQDAGYYKINFNASGYPSGLYLYRIEASGSKGSFSTIKKMLLIK